MYYQHRCGEVDISDHGRTPETVAVGLTLAQLRAIRLLQPGVIYDYRYLQGAARDSIWRLRLIDKLPADRLRSLAPRVTLTTFGNAVRVALQELGLA